MTGVQRHLIQELQYLHVYIEKTWRLHKGHLDWMWCRSVHYLLTILVSNVNFFVLVSFTFTLYFVVTGLVTNQNNAFWLYSTQSFLREVKFNSANVRALCANGPGSRTPHRTLVSAAARSLNSRQVEHLLCSLSLPYSFLSASHFLLHLNICFCFRCVPLFTKSNFR